MRITLAFVLVAILHGSSIAQTQKTGNATATTCSSATTGNNNKVVITCGIGREQGKKIIEILNHALASRDLATINSKMDELLQVAVRQPVLNQTCISGNCAGVNNGNQNINYATPHPPPQISSTQEPLAAKADANDMQKSMQPGIDRPGVRVTVTLSEVFYNPAFIVRCSVPCIFSGQSVNGVSSVQTLGSPTDPKIVGVAYTTPSQMMAGTILTLDLRSQDDTPITALDVEPYIPPSR
jgi:hypothetical protein